MSFLYDYQMDAVNKMHNGCILNGGVGRGKSRTGLYYYFKKQGGCIDDSYHKMINPKDLYIITTARKRDTLDWEAEMLPFLLSSDSKINFYDNTVVVDSWNNITKYIGIKNSFFIFDEDRVIGSGTWVKSFLKIAKSNEWILLSATPADSWKDYIPVFIANGFYKNRTEFLRMHAVFSRFTKYPKIEGYVGTGKLLKYRNYILVKMKSASTVEHIHEDVWVDYDKEVYKKLVRTRWNIYRDEPMQNAAELCLCLRHCVNSDLSRASAVLHIVELKKKVIIFYQYDFELEILRSIKYPKGTELTEWNGHKHQPIGTSDRFVYLVQYTAGAEGWNCITTDAIIFYSQSYSYKTMIQAAGRIDRVNTPYSELYYYHLKSRSGIDLAIAKSLREKKNFNENEYQE